MEDVCNDDDYDDAIVDGSMWSEVDCRSLESSKAHAKLSSRVLARFELFFPAKNKINQNVDLLQELNSETCS